MPKSKRGGKRLTPNLIDMVLGGLNSPRFRHGAEYRQNCQRCVYAYLMARKGHNVTAKPVELTATGRFKRNDPMMQTDSHGIPGWMRVMQGQTWKLVGASTATGATNNLNAEVNSWDDNAIGVVYCAWKNGSAHVFNVEKTTSGIKYVDAQNGTHVDIDSYMTDAKSSSIRVSRIDHLQPTKLIEECMDKNKGAYKK